MSRKSGNGKRPTYRVRFRELDKGRDGGLGSVKSCKMSLQSPNDAGKKLRKHAIIISVRQV